MARPTIYTFDELYTSIYGDLQTKTSAGQTLIGRVALRAIAFASAGGFKLMGLKIARVQKNVSPSTADPASKGGTLEEFGQLKLERDPFQNGSGEYTITVTGQEGGEVLLSSQLLSSNDSDNPGYLFAPTSARVIATGDTSVEVPIRALTAGKEAELSVGNSLDFTKPIANIDKLSTVSEVTVSPTQGESTEEYRAKVEESYALETQGGAPSDYRVWLNDVEGARTVYTVLPQGGTLKSYLEALPASSTDGNGTPSEAMLEQTAEVFEWDPDTTKELNTRGRRPQGVINQDVLPVVLLSVEVTITGLTDTSSATLVAIETALEGFLYEVRPYIAGADDPNTRKDTLTSGELSSVITSALPAGAYFETITMEIGGSVETKFKFTNGDIPFLLGVTV